MTDATAEPRRVLWLIKGLGPGGAENLLVAAAQVIDRARFTYEVGYLRADKSHLVEQLSDSGVSSRLLTQGPAGRLLWPWRLRRLMREQDIVHVHSPLVAGVARLTALTIPRSDRPAMVSTEHNEWPSFALPTRIVNAVTGPLDEHRFAVSERVRASMGRRSRRSTEVLLHGIVLSPQKSPRASAEDVRSELGIAADSVVGIIVANFRKDKDYRNVLTATRKVVDERPDFHLLVVGQGPLRMEVESLCHHLGLMSSVHLLGYRRDVAALLAVADIFVLGSAHEGLPVAVMEALAAGVPVAATDVGGMSEAVVDGECGLLVPPRDPEGLASAMLVLITDDGLRSRMAVRARQRSSIFDIRTAVERQEHVYAKLTGSTRV